MSRTRAYRRYQYEIRKERVRHRYYTRWFFTFFNEEPTPFWLGFHAGTPKPCSGSCCGNQRKWFGELTMQEKKAPCINEEW